MKGTREERMERCETMRTRVERLLQDLQDTVCQALCAYDMTAWREDTWTRPEGGGGRSRILQDGLVFEKVGVNTSTVSGALSPAAARSIRVDKEAAADAPFFATSISMVIHPRNPFAPTGHAHYRYFELGEEDAPHSWYFSGSADLTPSYLFEEDARHFHQIHKEVCDRFDPAFYPRFKQACDDYFYLPHRGECRGVGGLFLGNLHDQDQERLFDLTSSCAQAFLPAYLPLIERRHALPFQEEHVRWQRIRRGRYVEFNLLCDRGTAFGLQTGGRTESILMTLPLVAGWEYDYHPDPGSEEARMLEVLRHPRQWA